jgi:glutathione S-transferase
MVACPLFRTLQMASAAINVLTETVVPAVVGAAQNVYVLGAVGLVVTGFAIKKALAARKYSKFRAEIKAMPKGVVYLYAMVPRLTKGAPHIGFNIIKIEAYLRANKIPYEFHFTMDSAALSPTETVPFIALDGKLVGESQFCIDAIKKRFGIPEDEGLSASQYAIHTAVRRILDLSVYAHNSRTTMVDNAPVMKKFMVETFAPAAGIPGFVVAMMFGQFRKASILKLNTSGLGWLSDEQYQIEYSRDVKALSAFVADAKARGHDYLFGNKPSSVDCMLYGFISCARAAPEFPVNGRAVALLRTDKVLGEYAAKFEQEFYPDLNKIAPCNFDTQRFTSYGRA